MKKREIRSVVSAIVSLVFLLVTSSAQAQPQISSLSKTTSARSGLLLLNGTNFGSQQATGHVLIDGISAIVPTWTDTEIQAYVPESAGLGATTVLVETAGGISNAKTLDVTLRQSEGRFRWRFEMGFRSSGAWTAVAPDGTIYCSDPFRLYALAPDGALKWLVQDAGGERPISVSADGTIYTATNLAAGEVEGVIALNPDGSTRWTYIPETSGNFGVDLLAGPNLGPDGNIYAASNINLGGPGTFSLDANGTLLWSNSDSGPGSNSITNYEILFDVDQVYVTLWGQGGGPEVLTYDFGGDLLWTTGDLGLAVGSAPEIDPFGRLIMQWALIGIQAIDRDGSLQWIYDPPGSLGNVVGPTVGPDGVIYAGTWGGGDLFAINPDGTTKWLVEDQVAGFLWHMVVSPDNSTLIDGGAPDFGQPSTIRGFDTANGSLLWIQDFHFEEGLNEFAGWIEPNFSHDGNTIYVNTSFSGDTKPANLYAIDVSPQGSPTEIMAGSVGPAGEGATGTTIATFEITLSAPATEIVTVDYATTIAGYANPATPGVDYLDTIGVATFQPGETSFLIDVLIYGDKFLEADEEFGLELSNESANSVIVNALADTVIANDDLFGNGVIVDFGTPTSPVLSAVGTVSFGTEDYSSAIGMGWSNYVLLDVAERPVGNDLASDLAFMRSGTFSVDVPNDTYDITIYFGVVRRRDPFQLTFESDPQITELLTFGTNVQRTYTVTVTDGQLNMAFTGAPGLDQIFRISGFKIAPVAPKR